MAIVQTYESHLVGIGEPLSGRSDGSDTIKFLAFAQGFSYQYQKDIKRFKEIGKDDFYFNRQTDWADISVNITQFDSIEENYDILKNLNIFPSNEEFTSGTYYPFLRNIIKGGKNSNGSPIYFITDTGERARDVLGNNDAISRDFTVIDPCYLSSVSWSVAKNTVASFEYSFVGNYMRTGSYIENGDIVWDHIINTGNGDSYISTTGNGDVSSTSNEIDVNNVSGLFIGGYTNVSGAPDLGEIRGISWSVSIDRSNVQGLGNPMKYDRKISPEHIGQVTIEYNYEGQEFDLANVADVPYNIRIESKNKKNFFRIFKIENALIENIQLNSSTSGEPDSYSVTLSFKINKNGGLLYDIQQSESASTSSNDYVESILYEIIQLGSDIYGEFPYDESGFCIDINSNGDILAIGERYYDASGGKTNAGRVRIFKLNSSSWIQLGQSIDGEALFDESGASIDLNSNGDIIIIGARFNDGSFPQAGHARIFKYNSNTNYWEQLGQDIEGFAQDNNAGSSVAINSSGNIVAVGEPYHDFFPPYVTESGIIRIFQYNSNTNSWQTLSSILGLSSYDQIGILKSSIKLNSSGEIIVVGEPLYGVSNIGRVRVFQFNGSNWVQLGASINGSTSNNTFGNSVSINSTGNRIIVGESAYNLNRGRAIVFQFNGSNWVQLGQNLIGENFSDVFGISVSMNSEGNRIAVGATFNDDSGSNAGQVKIFQYNSTTNYWEQLGEDINGKAENDNSGFSISMNSFGNRVAVSAVFNDGTTGNPSDNRGHTRVFQINQV